MPPSRYFTAFGMMMRLLMAGVKRAANVAGQKADDEQSQIGAAHFTRNEPIRASSRASSIRA